MLGRVKRAVERLGGEVEITFMDPDAYEAWLAETGRQDTTEVRAAWAALQVGLP